MVVLKLTMKTDHHSDHYREPVCFLKNYSNSLYTDLSEIQMLCFRTKPLIVSDTVSQMSSHSAADTEHLIGVYVPT